MSNQCQTSDRYQPFTLNVRIHSFLKRHIFSVFVCSTINNNKKLFDLQNGNELSFERYVIAQLILFSVRIVASYVLCAFFYWNQTITVCIYYVPSICLYHYYNRIK